MIPTSVSAHLRKLLHEIVIADQDYDRRYMLVWQAMAVAAVDGLKVGVVIDSAEPDWPCAMIELSTGQVGWHMPRHEFPYDGHSTEEKFARIAALEET